MSTLEKTTAASLPSEEPADDITSFAALGKQVVQFGSAPAELARVRCCMLASKLQKGYGCLVTGETMGS